MEAFISEIKGPRDTLLDQRLQIYQWHASNAFKELRFLNPEYGKNDYHIYQIPLCDPKNIFYTQEECGDYVRDYFLENGFFAKLKKDSSLVFISWNTNLIERQKRKYIQNYIEATKAETQKDIEQNESQNDSETEEDAESEQEASDNKTEEFEITATTDRIELMKFLYLDKKK